MAVETGFGDDDSIGTSHGRILRGGLWPPPTGAAP
jgi:hypothetical protein